MEQDLSLLEEDTVIREHSRKKKATHEELFKGLKVVFFVKYFSLKKASEFPFFSKGFSLPSAGIMHPCA